MRLFGIVSILLASSVLRAAAPVKPNHPSVGEPDYFKTGILTLQDRIWAQTQIERVYYNHRIWPKENPGPKPPFEQMVPAAQIRAKVEDSLKKSAALNQYWQHPVTGEMLQAEIGRMAKQTHDPAMLRELFTALCNDPRLIAETLARETVADRLIHTWYANDTRFHAEVRARAEAAAARAGEADWKKLDGEYHHQNIILDDHADRPPILNQSPDERVVDAEEFAALKKRYLPFMTSPPSGGEVDPALRAGPGEGAARYLAADRINTFRVSDRPLTLPSPPEGGEGIEFVIPHPEETPDHFILTRVVAITDTRIEIDSIEIPKVPFATWWDNTAMKIGFEPFNHSNVLPQSEWMLPAIAVTSGCNTWNRAANLNGAPDGRYRHTAVWTGSELIIWGGTGGNTGGRYNPASDSWRSTSTGANVPSARYGHTAVWTGTEMIVWGGGFPIQFNTGGRYNPSSDSWLPTSTGTNVPSGRRFHTAVWTGSQMIIWGGHYYNGTSNYLNDGGRYNPSGNSWLTVSTGIDNPTARVGHTAVWTGSEMIIWGGSFYTTQNNYLNDGSRYNPSSDSWLLISTGANVPSGRRSHTATWTGSVMIIWGGRDGVGYPAQGGRYNPTTDSWLTVSIGGDAPAGRFGHTAIWSGSEMIIWGGSALSNVGARYNPSTDTWLATSTGTNVPSARSNHTAVWTGSEMIIWGGLGGTVYLNTGGRYNPAGDSWLPTFTGANLPEGREKHSAVWTGAEMIVWGGYSGTTQDNFFSTGGRYRPATDTWTATSTGANLLAGRYWHSAVWTGTEMIVWGGLDYSIPPSGIYYNDGGRYNPVADSWRSTSTGPGVPSARSYHTAVWTGSEMIVWGGYSYTTQDNYFNSGGRYNPISDAWSPTSTGVNNPSGRAVQSAVWTGDRMIIWGGYSFTTQENYFNDGGLYDPIIDSWQATSTGNNVPSARYFNTAVWTGSEMIVWGGANTAYLNTGARYNPANNSWQPTATGGNVPSPRYSNTAVWTGSEMIVWGGLLYCQTSCNVTLLNNGGRYSPYSDSWLPTSTGSNTPSGRYYHTAIWTGNEMIVWGGYNGGTYLDTGGLYASGSVASPGNSLRGNKSSFINLNWSNIFGAGSYNVKRCSPTTTSCIPGTIVSTPTINQYSEPNDPNSYFYAVEAVNACGAMP